MAGEMMETPYGQFTADFAVDRLVDLCDPEAGIQTGPFGSQLHQEDYVPVGTPIITVEHLGENRILHDGVPRVSDRDRDRLSRYLLREGDIVFSRVGSVDRRALVRSAEDGWMFSGRCLRVRPDAQKIDSGYLSYFFGLPTFKEHIRAIAVGATMPSLNTNLLSDVLVPYPQDLSEQRAIAHILGTLDDKIELNRRMSETLEAMARALFRSWFIDATRDGLPEGWCEISILDFANLLSGGTPRTEVPEYWDGDIPWVSAKDVTKARNSFILDTERKITKAGVENSPSKVLPALTTIVSARGTVGNHCLLGQEMAMNQTNYGLRAKDNRSHYFVFFSVSNLVEELRQQAYGTIFDTITTCTFQHTKIVRPPDVIIQRFESIVGSMMTKVLINLLESETLAALRDALLPKLISGELRVKDAERFLKERGL